MCGLAAISALYSADWKSFALRSHHHEAFYHRGYADDAVCVVLGVAVDWLGQSEAAVHLVNEFCFSYDAQMNLQLVISFFQ